MKNRTHIKDLKDHIDAEVIIGAVVDVARVQGKMAFFDFRDQTGTIQGVVFGKPEVLETSKELKEESAVKIVGKVNKRPEKMVKEGVINGDIELEITAIEILNMAAGLPFDLATELNIETHLDNLPLTLRTQRGRDIFAIQSTIVETFRKSLREQGFTEFQAPALVGGDAEGGAGAFEVPYFHDKTAYLATSPQLYKQIMVGVYERVFTTCRAFRAEKHATTRHLNEYITLDFEFGFIDDHEDVMRVREQVERDIVAAIKEKHTDILERFEVEAPSIPEEIPRMKFQDALALISKETGEDCTREPDLDPAHERWLCEYAKKEFDSDYIFITHYPTVKRPFYTYLDEEDPNYTKSFDLLFRGVEIVTGGQRLHDYETLVTKMEKKGLDPTKFEYYLQTFKYGIPPHGGCATGLERHTQKYLGLENVKEATLFPRDINRIDIRLTKVKGMEEKS